ncbi:MAG: hypothetical protein GXO54_04025 [Chloroflexi bacterium]|nr:hypothetical protein [Chloroflexota bacterium]
MSTSTIPSTPAQPKPSFGQRVAAFFRALIRLILWLIFLVLLLGGCAVTLAWGLPYLERTYVRPVQEMQVQMDVLARGLESLQARVNQNEEQTLARLQSLEEQVQQLQTEVQAVQEAVQALQKEQSQREADLEDRVERLSRELSKLQEQLAQLEDDVQSLGADLMLQTTEAAEQTQLQVAQLRVLLHIGQARLALVNQDLPLAQDEIGRARNLLDLLVQKAAAVDMPPAWFEAVREGQTRLEYAYNKVLTQPDLALKDLDIAWVVLTQAFEPETPVAVPADAMTETAAETTAEATPAPEVTGEATAAPTPTPTPTANP